jgi:hypothetical protein
MNHSTKGLPVCSKQRKFLAARTAILALACLALSCLAVPLRADALTGTVKDPSGAVITNAVVEISGGDLLKPIVLATDSAGNFAASGLKPGKYSVRVTKDGFDALVVPVDLRGTSDLQLSLKIAGQQSSITVQEKSSALANSDTTYRKLRDAGLGDSFRVENFTLTEDVGTFEFKSGTFTALQLINGIETGVVFTGQGHFTLTPIDSINRRELARRSGTEIAQEDFTEAVFRFTHDGLGKFAPGLGAKTDTPAEATPAFQRWRDKMRHRHEIPEGITQDLLESESIDNVDADVLAAVYNPQHPPFFNAYMRGTPHKDLRFYVRTRVGAVPQMDSSEEVGLINMNGAEMDDGVWYLAHLKPELLGHTANSGEDRRLFAVSKYKIETVIGKNNHLAAAATITFSPLIPGERVMKFSLLPNLRVARVKDESGADLHFVQERRQDDGSFYAILDKAPEAGKDHSITIEYAGDKVITEAGPGSYYIGDREDWYPNLSGGGFGMHSLFDLTFKVQRSYKLISVGELKSESTEEGFAVTHWVTPVPVAIAGFNYGDYKKVDLPDDKDGFKLSGYFLTELPSILQRYSTSASLGAMSPTAMTKYALEQTRAQMQLCTFFFGKIPYNSISITEQPNMEFGQSWPNLVYLPILAYMDDTQRWELFGRIDTNISGFVTEVTPHEVSHQWWGHAVSWASYHDQWLSEGFADFSAGLFLQQAVGPKWDKGYLDYWDRQRKRIIEKNNFGISANDAGPLWLGLRLISPKSDSAYQGLTYSKGAYVLKMLRSLMYDDHTDDANKEAVFIAMMHDFVATHENVPASTESFKAIAEKHMSKQLDLQHNGRLDWFFSEWVYGTELPKYDFKYEIQPAVGGKVKLHITLTQSQVDEHFAMFVPVFADFGHGMQRLGQIPIAGSSTRTMDYILPAQPKKVALNYFKDVLER